MCASVCSYVVFSTHTEIIHVFILAWLNFSHFRSTWYVCVCVYVVVWRYICAPVVYIVGFIKQQIHTLNLNANFILFCDSLYIKCVVLSIACSYLTHILKLPSNVYTVTQGLFMLAHRLIRTYLFPLAQNSIRMGSIDMQYYWRWNQIAGQ